MSKPTNLHIQNFFGEVRSLESSLESRDDRVEARIRQAFELLREVADPGLKEDLGKRLERVFVAHLERALEAHGWVELGERVYTYTPGGADSKFTRFTLVGIVSADTRTFGVVCPPQPGRNLPAFVDRLGTAVGLTQIEGMLTCIDSEFTPRESVVEIDEATILAELERRRAYISTLDPQLFDIPHLVSDACGVDEFARWFEQAGLDVLTGRHPEGDESCQVRWARDQHLYEPLLSTSGTFADDCSVIWAARGVLLASDEEALDWARERAGRAPAYYRLSNQWRYVCTGKQWNKYSGCY